MELTLHAMLEGVFHENEKLLQLRVVISHCLAQTHRCIYQALDGNLEHVEQIGAFHHTVQRGFEHRDSGEGHAHYYRAELPSLLEQVCLQVYNS